MTEIADLSALDLCASQLAAAAERPFTAWVPGGAGSGRGELARRVAQRVQGSVFVDLVPLQEPDAALHGLLQAAGKLSDRKLREEAASESGTIRERARKVAEELGRNGEVLLVRAPKSWRFGRVTADDDKGDPAWDLLQGERGRQLLQGFLQAEHGRVVLLTTKDFEPGSVSWDPKAYYPLPHARANLDALLNHDLWGGYAQAAERLHAHLGGDVQASPFELRISVGLSALGTGLDLIQDALESGGSLVALGGLLKDALTVPGREALLGAVRRLAVARQPLQREAVAEIARPPDADLPLLTSCVGYGENQVRMSESVRVMLLDELGSLTRDEARDTHLNLAAYHERLDGVAAPEDAGVRAVPHWLEKVHHLAHSGAAGFEKWSSLRLQCREFFLDRARSLSIEEKDYAGAASMYSEYVKLAPADAYGWHYLGWNLDKCDLDPERAEAALRMAVQCDEGNPWWNSRLVTFLIRRVQFQNATREWRLALKRVDPEGRLVREGPWLSRHFHRWVVVEWLEYGEVAAAREAFNAIPAKYREGRVARQLEDAEQSLELGESVYPEYVDLESRWKKPLQLPESHGGLKLSAWYPGRVVEAGPAGVRLLVATTDRRRLVVNTISADEWSRAGWCTSPHEAADRFVEVGIYGNGQMRVMQLPLLPGTSRSG